MRLFDVQESDLLKLDGFIYSDGSEEQSFALKVQKEIQMMKSEQLALNNHIREESKRSSVIEDIQYCVDIPIPMVRPNLEISNTLK